MLCGSQLLGLIQSRSTIDNPFFPFSLDTVGAHTIPSLPPQIPTPSSCVTVQGGFSLLSEAGSACPWKVLEAALSQCPNSLALGERRHWSICSTLPSRALQWDWTAVTPAITVLISLWGYFPSLSHFPTVLPMFPSPPRCTNCFKFLSYCPPLEDPKPRQWQIILAPIFISWIIASLYFFPLLSRLQTKDQRLYDWAENEVLLYFCTYMYVFTSIFCKIHHYCLIPFRLLLLPKMLIVFGAHHNPKEMTRMCKR